MEPHGTTWKAPGKGCPALAPCLWSHESLKPGMCPSIGSGNLASSSMEPPRPSAALSSGESWGDCRRRRSPSSLPEGGICEGRRAGTRSRGDPSPESDLPESTLCAEPLATLHPLPAAAVAAMSVGLSLRNRKPSSPRRAGKTAEETWLGSGSVVRVSGQWSGLGLGSGLGWG